MMTVRIFPNEKGNPPGKLADAELHFMGDGGAAHDADSALNGLKLIGFAIWERRTGGGRNVTFPARQYSVNGERRSFSLLRPSAGDVEAQNRLRDVILEAYAAYEAPPAELPASDPLPAEEGYQSISPARKVQSRRRR
jgi:hypothetical protein